MPRACGVSSYHARPSSADTQFHLRRGAHSARPRLCRRTLPIVRFRSDLGGETHRSLGFGDRESDAEYMANPRTGGVPPPSPLHPSPASLVVQPLTRLLIALP